MSKVEQCYNCTNLGTTREHVIPRFLLCHGENGLTVSCCETCRDALKWLDDYGSDYFKFNESKNDINEWNKWFKQQLVQNGSPMSLRTFGEYTVIDENLLMYFIQKVCMGVTNYLYGKPDHSYRLYIFTDFSKLGGFCHFNDPKEPSYSQKQTEQIEKARGNAISFLKNIMDSYSLNKYEVKNAKLFCTEQIVYGAKWFHINLYNTYNIYCAVTNEGSEMTKNSRNMIMASLSVTIDLKEIEQLRNSAKQNERGDSLAYILAGFPISPESKALRRSYLTTLGVPIEEIETFEASLLELMNNKGGRERLARKFIEEIKNKK